jgi:hypothetical protein
MRQQYKEAAKQKNLSRSFVEMGRQLRQELDQAGGRNKVLVLAGDGSFCNRTCCGEIPERSVLLVRARKDAKLCFRAPASEHGPRRFYGIEKFTPEQVRQDGSREWKTVRIFYGGKRRKIRYKEVAEVYWQRGAKQRPLRLLVIAPTPYRKSKSKRLYYRDPAFLLTTDLRNSTKQLLQIYFDRWQIEVNHREEQDTLGVGQAQLWNVTSAPNSRCWRWLLTAPCCWPRSRPLAPSAAPLMPNCPSGGETLDDHRAWILLRSCARKWRNDLPCSTRSISRSSILTWFAPPRLEIV